MADAHIADAQLVLADGRLHGAVGVHHVGGSHDGAFLQGLFHKDFTGAAAVFAGVDRDGGVSAAQGLPVGDLAGKDVLGLLGRDGPHLVGGVDHQGHTVDGEGEALQAVLGDLFFLEGAAGIADLHQTFAHLLHAHAGTAAGHGDADVGVGGHDVFGSAFHDRDVGRAAGDIKRAGKALEAVQGSGMGRHGKDQARHQGGQQETAGFHDDLSYGKCGLLQKQRETRQGASPRAGNTGRGWGARVRYGTTTARPGSISGHIIQERCRKATGGRCWAASYLEGIARKGLALSGSRQDHPFPAHMPERTDLPTGVRRMRQQKRICMVTSSHCRPKAAVFTRMS